jgi:uncharacterized protein YdaL
MGSKEFGGFAKQAGHVLKVNSSAPHYCTVVDENTGTLLHRQHLPVSTSTVPIFRAPRMQQYDFTTRSSMATNNQQSITTSPES